MSTKYKVEYRVVPVTRYYVSRYHQSLEENGCEAGSEGRGEFDNEETAFAVAYALCAEEHRKAGTPLDDPNFQYPKKRENVACKP